MITQERYNAITRNAIEGQALGANKEELQEMVIRLSKSLVVAANANNMKRDFKEGMPVTWLTRDQVLHIGEAMVNMQVLADQGTKPGKEDHDALNEAIRMLKPNSS